MTEQIVVVAKTDLQRVLEDVKPNNEGVWGLECGRYSQLDGCLGTMPRTPALERNQDWVQLVSYTVLQDRTKRVFVYQRTKGVGEERLLGKLSLGLGGHFNLEDFVKIDENTGGISPNDFYDTYERAIGRELVEELSVEIGDCHTVHADDARELIYNAYSDDKWPALLYRNNNETNAVHVGFVEVLELGHKGEDLGLQLKESGLIAIGWLTHDELQARRDEFEDWSKDVMQWLS